MRISHEVFLKLAAVFVVMCSSFALKAQNKVRFPLWIFNTDSTTIYGVSVGYTHTDKIDHVISNGIRLEAIGFGLLLPLIPRDPIMDDDSIFRSIISAPVKEKINGLNLSPLGSGCDCAINGMNIYGMGSIVNWSNGLSVGLFGNFSYRHNGIQLAGMGNSTYQMNGMQIGLGNSNHHNMNGIQLGVFGNHNGNIMRGIQIGISNDAEKLRGLQIGIYNKSNDTKGFQIGIWNVNERRKFPILNW